MNNKKTICEVTESIHCPLYVKGDTMSLTMKSFSSAEDKGSYRFIAGLSPADQKAAEIGEFMILLMEGVQKEDERTDEPN